MNDLAKQLLENGGVDSPPDDSQDIFSLLSGVISPDSTEQLACDIVALLVIKIKHNPTDEQVMQSLRDADAREQEMGEEPFDESWYSEYMTAWQNLLTTAENLSRWD